MWYKDLKPEKATNGKFGYVDSNYKLNWRLRGKIIDFENSKYEILPIYDEARNFINGFARVNINGKWGIINEEGVLVIKPLYEDVFRQKNGLFRVKVKGKWGLIDEYENFIHPPQFDEIGNKCYDNLIAVKINEKIGFINSHWEYVVKPQFDAFHYYIYESDCLRDSFELMQVEVGEKKGLLNTRDGHFIFEPQFDFISDYVFCWFLRVRSNEKWGIISTFGEIIAKPIYDEIEGFHEHVNTPYDLAIVRINDKWGIINREGDFVVELQSHVISFRHREGYVKGIHCIGLMIGDKRKVYLNKSKRIVDKIIAGNWGLSRFVVNNKIGFIKDDYVIIEPKYDDADDFSCGFAKVKVLGKWGLIDLNGDYYFDPIFDAIVDKVEIYDSHYPLIRVIIGDKIGFLNIDDHLVVEPKFEEVIGREVKINGKWGVINGHGEYILEPLYEQIKKDCYYLDDKYFNVFWVKKHDKWGLISKDSSLIIDFIFDDVKGFSHLCGIAGVKICDKWGYVFYSGCMIIKAQFDDIKNFDYSTGLSVVKISGKWGCINTLGHFVVEPRYDYIGEFKYGLAIVVNDKQKKCINKYGTIYDYDYYLQHLRKKRSDFGSFYGSVQESADEGWDMIAGDAGVDGDYDVDALREFLGID